MAKKLKTFVTSIGFYDLAIAAPSMKAALEAWGAKQNLFHQGLAEETRDADVIDAALSKPGVVLRRAIGTSRSYQEHAAPPHALPAHTIHHAQGAKPKAKPRPKVADKAAAKTEAKSSRDAQQAAILSFQQARANRDRARRKDEAVKTRQDAEATRRKHAVDKARATHDRARMRHEAKMEILKEKIQDAEDRLAAEQKRWRKQAAKLESAMRDTGF